MGAEWDESEKPAIEQLKKMGYEYKEDRDILRDDREARSSVLLPDRFKNAIKRINPDLTDDDADEVLGRFQDFDTNGNLEANEIAHARLVGTSHDNLMPITLERNWGDGMRNRTVRLVDFDNVENNDFLITNQFKMAGYKDDIKPDIVLFVNGIPLAVIECKSPDIPNPIDAAINDNLDRYQMGGRGYDSLFHYNQVLVACSGTEAKYAPTFGEPHHYRNWNDPFPLTRDEVDARFGRSRAQEVLIAGMFDQRNFLSLIRNFVVYDGAGDGRRKKIAKYQQFRAVSKTIKKIGTGTTKIQKGGVIWHTQGSGKSLTMLWLAHQIRRLFENPTILIVTDRIQLDNQIHATFRSCGFPNPVHATGKENLKSQIENNRGNTIMTTIQKFLSSRDQDSGPMTEETAYVLVDEGHRTQYGLTASDMRAAMPNAVFFAYTGTPLLKNNETRDAFGDYIDKYKLAESEADGTTLPIYYESRLAELAVEGNKNIDKIFERLFRDLDEKKKEAIRRKYASPTAIAEVPERIERIVEDIIEDYDGRIRPNGYKAMIVAPSKRAAVTYKEKLAEAGVDDCKIVMSNDPNDKKYGWDRYWLTKSDLSRVLDQFKKPGQGSLSILIVVDMLLTGFDAPILQALYLDQKITNHTLLQAIARVNRPYNEQKTRGFIVDYAGNASNLKEAFELYDDADIKMLVRPFTTQIERLERRHMEVMSHFDGVDRDDWETILEILTPDDVRTRFEEDFKKFTKEMDAVLPDPQARRFRDDLSFLSKARIRARNLFAEGMNLAGYGEKVRKLINKSIGAENIVTVIDMTKIEPHILRQVIDGAGGTNKTRASAIQRWVQKTVEENREKDPEFYKSLVDRLQEIIRVLKEKNYDDAFKFNELRELLDSAYSQEKELEKLGFDDMKQFSTYNSLKKVFGGDKPRIITHRIFEEVSELLGVVGYHKKENILKNMRSTVKDVLKDNGMEEFEEKDALAREIVDAWVKREQ